MSEKYTPVSPKNHLLPTLTREQLTGANEDALRVLLALSDCGYNATVNELSKATGMGLSKTATALEYWLTEGVIREGDAPAHLPEAELIPGGAAQDAAVIREKELKECLDLISHILGHLLNPTEIGVLVSIINDLGVSAAYLTTLTDYCVNTLGRSGVKYVEKVAMTLSDKGIVGEDALDEYIRGQEAVRGAEGQIRRLWGIGSRALTQKETDMLGKWLCDYGYNMDVIGAAYDITANTASRVTLSYADKILTEWYTLGIRDLGGVEAHLEEKKKAPKPMGAKKKTQGKPSVMSYDVNDFFKAALERSYGSGEGEEK